jgi:RecA C-terminal domain
VREALNSTRGLVSPQPRQCLVSSCIPLLPVQAQGTGGANKCAPPFRQAEFDIRWGVGIDSTTDLLDQAIERGVVDQRGSHFSFGEQRLGQGRERARQTILQTDALALAMRDALTAAQQSSPLAASA